VRLRFVPEVGQLVLTKSSRTEEKRFQEVPYPEGGVELLGYERQVVAVVWALLEFTERKDRRVSTKKSPHRFIPGTLVTEE
jgi:hypothetical protein